MSKIAFELSVVWDIHNHIMLFKKSGDTFKITSWIKVLSNGFILMILDKKSSNIVEIAIKLYVISNDENIPFKQNNSGQPR